MQDTELITILSIMCNTWATEMQADNAQMLKEKCYTNQISNLNLTVNDNKSYILDFFLQGPNRKVDKGASVKITKIINSKFTNAFFSGKGCFEGIFTLHCRHITTAVQRRF